MRTTLPDLHVGLPILLMWLAVVLVIVAGYLLHRAWRRRHPAKPVPRETSYSHKLQERLAARRGSGTSKDHGLKSGGGRGGHRARK